MTESVSLTRDLRDALSGGRLAIAYQPQWDIGDYADPAEPTPVMVEALCRWRHDVRGVISPDVFIPLAEAADFIDELDLHILGRAAREVAEWRAAGFDIGLAVNSSPTQFSLSYAERVVAGLEASGLAPGALTVEVTEAPAPQLRPGMRSAMELLRGIGVAISVDDFDGDATTVRMLETLPIDEVKIDRALTRRDDVMAEDLIARVVEISEQRGWRTVAEGIETIDDLERARRRNCRRGQGYLWGQPTAADEIERMLQRA